MATAGKLGAVYAPLVDVDNNVQTTTTTDTFSGDGTTTTFQLTNEYIERGSVTVTVDTVEQDEGTYEVNYITGELVFDTAPASGTDNISVEYTYLNGLEQIGGFYEWSVDEDAGLEESPEFGDSVVTHTQTLESWSGSANMYFGVDDRFREWVGDEIVVAFYIDTTAGTEQRFEGWAKISTKSTDVPVDTLIEESLEFEGQTKLEYRTA